ncbi:MAG: bifunctional diguanylate cyclase/phosphodiesterase [Ilumatobacteraceae bacterium]
MPDHTNSTRSTSLTAFVAATTVAATLAAGGVWLADRSLWHGPVNWRAFGVLMAMYFAGELHSIGWLRRRGGGEVTPGWAFSYALLLLGAPAAAVVATATASLIPDIVRRRGVLRICFNASQTVIALSIAALMLTLIGQTRPLGVGVELNPVWLIVILLAAAVIFVTNSVLTAIVIAIHQDVSIAGMLRKAAGLSVSADGALLALSPLFVIAADYNLMTAPLLGLIAFLVFHSARQALEREHRASHDHLTSLLNAQAFIEHLDGHLVARGSGGDAGFVLLLDLDGFKQVNDRLGHHIGDAVLNQVGQRLVFHRDAGAVASRLGGDEFAVLFPDVADVDAAMQRARELADVLGSPLVIDGFPVRIGASIGVVMLDRAWDAADEVLRHADIAMYEAKRTRSTVALADTRAVSTQSGGRLALLAGLRGALDSDVQLWMAYQPLVELQGGQIIGFEALLRWQHPAFGPIPPGDFITLAENTDLIAEITEHVIELVAADSDQLLSVNPDLKLAVNVSSRNLASRQFPDLVSQVLETHQLSPRNISIEVTESAFDGQSELAADVVERLRASGLAIAIDDFGAGYSWLSRLLSLPVDQLKIDRSLVCQMTNDTRAVLVVKTIVELAHAMGITCTAEGVEDLGVIHQLRAIGCDHAQGYAIATPMAATEAARWLSERPFGIPVQLEHVS